MKSLIGHIRENFEKEYQRVDLEKILAEDKDSVEFIRKILNDNDFSTPNKDESLYAITQARARHSLISMLVGKIFGVLGNLYQRCRNIANDNNELLWTLTALYHDKGYYSEYLKNTAFKFEQTFQGYYLLDEKNKISEVQNKTILAYTYDEIKNYAEYKSKYYCENRSKDGDEKVDHGILGGCIVYRDYMRKKQKIKEHVDDDLTKAFCLTIAQHNIFKSKSETDEVYKQYNLQRLTSSSDFKISWDTPLLLLLSLVDTVECVKTLSKGENPQKYLQTMTVLESIDLEVNENEMKLDYTKIRDRITEKGDADLKKKFNNYLNAVEGLGNWTIFKTNMQESQITITF